MPIDQTARFRLDDEQRARVRDCLTRTASRCRGGRTIRFLSFHSGARPRNSRRACAGACRGPMPAATCWRGGGQLWKAGIDTYWRRRRQRGAAPGGALMVKIAISVEAFEAIALPPGGVAVESHVNERGDRRALPDEKKCRWISQPCTGLLPRAGQGRGSATTLCRPARRAWHVSVDRNSGQRRALG